MIGTMCEIHSPRDSGKDKTRPWRRFFVPWALGLRILQITPSMIRFCYSTSDDYVKSREMKSLVAIETIVSLGCAREMTASPKKASKLRATGLCAGNSPVTGEFPAQRASDAENASIWWRHHASSEMTHTGYLFFHSLATHSNLQLFVAPIRERVARILVLEYFTHFRSRGLVPAWLEMPLRPTTWQQSLHHLGNKNFPFLWIN